MGGVMRLGKVLATGVAEERDHSYEQEPRLPEATSDARETRKLEAAAAEEVPVAR
jgi:hypothetical protein